MSGLNAGLAALREFILAQRAAAASAPEVKMLQGVYRGYAGDLPETVYHAGAAFKDAPKPGTFVNKDKAAVRKFGKATGAAELHTFDAKPRRGGDEKDVLDMARRMGIYEEGVPAGQYLEQGDNAIYPQSAQLVEELHNMGLDHLLLDDGMSATPSMVVLDPSMLTRNNGVFVSPQKRVADYYANKRAAQTGETPHAEMLLVDPFVGDPYTHTTMGSGAQAPLTTQARKIQPDDIVDRTQLYAEGGRVSELKATPSKNPSLAWLAEKLGQVDSFARKDNPPVAMLSDLFGIPAIQRTMERSAYGEPLTTGRGMTTRMRPDTEEALLAAPQFASPLGKMAQLTKGLPVGASIKNKGGNWLSGSVEDALKGLKPRIRTEGIDGHTAENAATDTALNNWIDKQLTRYVKNEMATPEDPIRALAEQGVLHRGINPYYPTRPSLGNRVNREHAGFDPEGMASSDLAKYWENVTDNSVRPSKAGEFLEDYADPNAEVSPYLAKNPWLEKVPPETPVHEIYSTGGNLNSDAGFSHLIDELRNATNPDSGLPLELQLKYSSLNQVSVPQAVQRVADINAWRAEQKVAADLAKANNAATALHKDYPDKGFKWVELKSPEPYTGGSIRDDHPLQQALKYEGETMGHCVGGYCPDVMEGRSRIFSLRDAKGQPHTTIEVAPSARTNVGRQDVPDRYFDEAADMLGDDMHPDIEAMAAELYGMENPIGPNAERIVQIKGKGNKAPNPEYLPFVQDFVKSGKWSDVGDLHNTGLQKWGDRYLSREEIDALTPEETDAFASRNIGKPNFAAGGLAEAAKSGYNPARIDAMVEQLRTELFQ